MHAKVARDTLELLVMPESPISLVMHLQAPIGFGSYLRLKMTIDAAEVHKQELLCGGISAPNILTFTGTQALQSRGSIPGVAAVPMCPLHSK